MTTTEAAVRAALSGVRDPELDEPLTDLGFVAAIAVRGAAVEVRLRLPTYFCAPTFAFLMAADARAAVLALPGVDAVDVALDDHFTSAEIGEAVGRGRGFAHAFPGEATGGLDDLRTLFARKAFLARQARLCDALVRRGLGVDELAALRVGDLADVPEAAPYLARRAELGLGGGPDAPALVRPDGGALDAAALPRHLRVARLVRLSLEGNAGLCRGLLRTRYGIPDAEEVATP